jgi:hypothetical protein
MTVPFFTREGSRLTVACGSWAIRSMAKVMSCRMPWLSIATRPRSPASTNGIATRVLSAFPCAPLLGPT